VEGLIKAFSDVLAAVLGAIGFVGRPRRRASIRQDLELLRDLEQSPEFEVGTDSHGYLVAHIEREVAKHAGAVVPRRKQVPWSSVVICVLIGAPLGYWTFVLDHDGFRLVSLLPGVAAGLLAIAAVGMIVDPDSAGSSADQHAVQALADETNAL
jgi:hypothetical protein